MAKSKLKMALAADKGTDFKKLKEKRQKKAALKRKQAEEGPQDSDDHSGAEDAEVAQMSDESDDDEEYEDAEEQINLHGIDESDSSGSEVEMEERLPRKPKTILKPLNAAKPIAKPGKAEDADSDEDEDEEDEEDIPISDLEDLDEDEKEDLIPHTRLTINNTSALLTSLNRIALPTDKSVPFATHQVVVSAEATADSIPDIQDDLQRELAFYSQSLAAVREARTKLRAEKVPFSRPKDYFAEMIKEDAHMEKIKAKLVEEATNKKAAAEARKMRDLKKFGKQVQVAKLQERQKAKRETLDKIKNLKRKRSESGNDMGTKEADIFDVGVDKELSKNSTGRSDRAGAGRGGKPNTKRQKKDEKYGFGGKKRHAKSGDFASSSDLSGFSAKAMKAKGGVSKSRPGKSKRKAMSTR